MRKNSSPLCSFDSSTFLLSSCISVSLDSGRFCIVLLYYLNVPLSSTLPESSSLKLPIFAKSMVGVWFEPSVRVPANSEFSVVSKIAPRGGWFLSLKYSF